MGNTAIALDVSMSFRYDDNQGLGGVIQLWDSGCGSVKQITEFLTPGCPLVVQNDFPTPANSHGLQGDEDMDLTWAVLNGDAKVALPFVALSLIIGLLVATGW
jgi:hypothetical protein